MKGTRAMPLGLKLLASVSALLVLTGCDGGDDDSSDNTPFGSTFQRAFNQDPNDEPIDIEDDAGLALDLAREPTDI